MEAEPSRAELCTFSEPPGKACPGLQRARLAAEAGLSFKSLLFPKARVGRMDGPCCWHVPCPHEGGIAGGLTAPMLHLLNLPKLLPTKTT